MDQGIIQVICFSAGMLVQSVLMLGARLKDEWKSFLLSIGAGIFSSFFVGWGDDHLQFSIFFGLVMFCIFFAVFFRKKILPVINEGIILIMNIIVAYLIWSDFSSLRMKVFGVLFILPTLAVFFICFTDRKLSFPWKVSFYVWFLVMNVFIICKGFAFGSIFGFLGSFQSIFDTVPPEMGLADIALSGMIFLCLLFNLVCALDIIPIPRKGQSLDDRREEVKEYVHTLSKKYSDMQLPLVGAVSLIVVLSGALVLNKIFGFVSDALLINLTLLVFINIYSGDSAVSKA